MLASSPPDILFEIMYVPKMFCSNIILYSKAEILNKESLFQIISEIQTNMFVLHLIGFFFSLVIFVNEHRTICTIWTSFLLISGLKG